MAAPATEGADITLYMPTTTPSMSQGNDWGTQNFDGPLGMIKGNLVAGATEQIMGANFSSYEEGKKTGKRVVDGIKNQFESALSSGGGALRQFGVGVVAGVAGMKPNQLLALQRGEIFNPNVELLYNGPRVRGFSFSFTFVPKDPAEAEEVNKIIKEFKIWSAPENLDNGMFKVPHVWQVEYQMNGIPNPNMNLFKRSALTDVAVQDNSGMNMHMSFDDGMPILKTVSLNFTEVDVITRNDHRESNNNVGY